MTAPLEYARLTGVWCTEVDALRAHLRPGLAPPPLSKPVGEVAANYAPTQIETLFFGRGGVPFASVFQWAVAKKLLIPTSDHPDEFLPFFGRFIKSCRHSFISGSAMLGVCVFFPVTG